VATWQEKVKLDKVISLRRLILYVVYIRILRDLRYLQFAIVYAKVISKTHSYLAGSRAM
jgi:hypothetical protein